MAFWWEGVFFIAIDLVLKELIFSYLTYFGFVIESYFGCFFDFVGRIWIILLVREALFGSLFLEAAILIPSY